MPDWQQLPHEVLFHIFSFLGRKELTECSCMCKSWYTSANDDMLWKRLFLSCYKLPRTTQIANFGLSWKSEFERLSDKAPCEEMQVRYRLGY